MYVQGSWHRSVNCFSLIFLCANDNCCVDQKKSNHCREVSYIVIYLCTCKYTENNVYNVDLRVKTKTCHVKKVFEPFYNFFFSQNRFLHVFFYVKKKSRVGGFELDLGRSGNPNQTVDTLNATSQKRLAMSVASSATFDTRQSRSAADLQIDFSRLSLQAYYTRCLPVAVKNTKFLKL